ncbi:nesprin-2-like [Rhinophrynus dorsalis]
MYFTYPEGHEDSGGCKMCSASVEKRVRVGEYRQLCALFLDALSRFEDWLQGVHIAAFSPDPSQTPHREAQLAVSRYEVLLSEMREKLLELESLNRKYWRLSQAPHQDILPSDLRGRMQEINQSWDQVQREAEAMHQSLKIRVQHREQFESDREEMRRRLTDMDLGLSSVEYIYSGNSTEKIQRLQAFQEDVRSNMEQMEGLFERGDILIDDSDAQDAEELEKEMEELGCYCQEIFSRVSRFQKRLVSTKLVFEDDLLAEDMEIMSHSSSDVFLEIESEDGAVPTPPVESTATSLPLYLQGTSVEAVTLDLEWDPLGDIGRTDSNDGQESFHTATSAPWKILHRQRSQSSLNSIPWTTGSEHREREDVESLGDVQCGLQEPGDSHSLEEISEESGNQGEVLALSAHIQPTQVPSCCVQEEAPGPVEDCPSSYSEILDPGQSASDLTPKQAHEMVRHTSGQGKLVTSDSQVNSQLVQSVVAQRRRQGQRAQNLRMNLYPNPNKQEVAILMDNGDSAPLTSQHKASRGALGNLRSWSKRLVYLSVLVLLLGGALIFLPPDRTRCPSHRFAWSLMLTYVNGPPPT